MPSPALNIDRGVNDMLIDLFKLNSVPHVSPDLKRGVLSVVISSHGESS